MIKIHMHAIYPLAMLLKEVSTIPSIHPTKCSIICVGLSLSSFYYKKKRHGLSLKKERKRKKEWKDGMPKKHDPH